jgi:putative phosphonate catabolism associated alcohol dehydrogenase
MSAWVFTDCKSPLELVRFSLDTIDLGAEEILVRIDAATICGSDVHTIDGKRIDPAAPLILGHEGCGTVLREGGKRDESLVGSRITWSVMSSCGSCVSCSQLSLPQKCTSALFKYGHASFKSGSGLYGCYSTHIVLKRGTCIVRLPDEISNAIAAPANCALATVCCAMRSALRSLGLTSSLSEIPSGARVLVQGCGLLGLYAIALARDAGAAVITATDVSESRLELAKRFGATRGYNLTNPSETPLANEFDVVFEVCGVVSAVKQGIAALRPGGSIILVGLVHPQSDLSGVTAESIIRKCASVVGVHNYAPEDLQAAVDFLTRHVSKGDLPFSEITSKAISLSLLPEAIDLAKSGKYPRILLNPLL